MKSTIHDLKNANRFSMSKKAMLLALMVFGTTAMVNAQTAQEIAAKNDLKTLNQKAAIIKKEKQNVKRELRDLKSQDVNQDSKSQFKLDFGTVSNVQWRRKNDLDEVKFVKDGKSIAAFYDDNAKLVGTTTIKSLKDLPADAQKTIAKDYKDYTAKEVILFEDNDDNDTNMILYNLRVENVKSYFVELTKGNKNIAVMVSMNGNVKYFTELK